MTIQVKCRGCRKSFEVPDNAAGKKVKCKACGTLTKIPAAADDYEDYVDDFEVEEDDYEDYRDAPESWEDEIDRPSRRKRRSTAGRPKSKKKKRKRRKTAKRGGYGMGVPTGVTLAIVGVVSLIVLNVGSFFAVQAIFDIPAAAAAAVGGLVCISASVQSCLLVGILIPTRFTWYVVRGFLLLGIIGTLLALINDARLIPELNRMGFVAVGVMQVFTRVLAGGILLGIYRCLGDDESREFYGFEY